MEAASSRGATIYGEILGSGMAFVADRKRAARRRDALVQAMRAAFHDANLAPEAVDHVHAHGLSTRTCDIEEAAAIAEVFGSRVRRLPVVAAKSYFGNLGAASGMVELVASLMALRHGTLFPVLNFKSRDPECDVRVVEDLNTPAGNVFVNLSVTPQGQAACVVVGQATA
jgi:3-oxoacyl-[acyl-carrier-protein] synthase II